MGEKVAVKGGTDSKQQVCVYALALEDFVDVGAVAVELLCEPHHSVVLAAKFFLYNFANINVAHKLH